jgi:Zn-dependent peptidase ImmA (M78 family)
MPSRLRRGFKAEAERISLEIRRELGLTAHGQLDCLVLATHLDIPVIRLGDLVSSGADTKSVNTLLGRSARFSALTVSEGRRKLIVYNHRHPPGRQANSLAHELSHVILEHPQFPALGAGGCRYWNSEHEEEADWLGGALLVPREGALRWLYNGGNNANGAEHFGVSLPLFEWRVNHSGISKQIQYGLRGRRREK